MIENISNATQVLKTYQGVIYHAHALDQLNAILGHGDASPDCLSQIRAAEAQLRSLRAEHLRRALRQRVHELQAKILKSPLYSDSI